MLPFDGLTSDAFLTRIDQLVTHPAGRLVVPAPQLLSELSAAQIDAVIEKRLGEAPSLAKHVASVLTLPSAASAGPAAWLKIGPSAWTAGFIGATLTHAHATGKHRRRRNAIIAILGGLELSRAAIGLTDKEHGLIRAMAALFADGAIPPDAWSRFAALMTWGGGACSIAAHPSVAHVTELPEARLTLAETLKAGFDGHDAFLAATAALVARRAQRSAQSARSFEAFLSPGARWMTAEDVSQSAVMTFDPSPAALIVGHEPASGRPIYFARNESLFSIGGPGTGKTECQVLPNLLSYAGSAVVLDVKGELWEKTAAYRARHFGPVYRFAPTDPAGRSHRYNPFDFIGTDPEKAATDCEVFSFQVVTPTPGHHDPYWENRGRDFLWAMAMIVALRSKGRNRAMATLMRLLSVPLDVKAAAPDYVGSATDNLVKGLGEMAVTYRIPALAEHANAIRGGLGSQRLESVADNARRFLNIFSRSATLRAAMSRSDWHPRQLRERPGTTVYLCLPGDDLDTFAPIVRLILQQHANALLRDFTYRKGEPPVTFFLDEFPQLKRMESILRLLDTGRGAGVRLWLFAQYLGQIRQAYDKQADGLIGACRVRSFLSPDAEAAESLKPYLGTTRNLFTGEKHPLAEPHELVGPAFADTILSLADGPYRLAKRFAFATMADRIRPPPIVPALPLIT